MDLVVCVTNKLKGEGGMSQAKNKGSRKAKDAINTLKIAASEYAVASEAHESVVTEFGQ